MDLFLYLISTVYLTRHIVTAFDYCIKRQNNSYIAIYRSEKMCLNKNGRLLSRESASLASNLISAGNFHTLTVKSDGIVLSTGKNRHGQSE